MPLFFQTQRWAILGCLLVLALSYSAAMDVTEADISFSSQLIETHLVFRKDSSRSASQGIGLSVSLSGSGAPQVNPEDVLVKNGGLIEVRPAQAGISNANKMTGHSSLFVFVLLGIAGLCLGQKFKSPITGALMLSFALLLSTVISLQDFSSSWTLEVVATVPESFTLQSLTVNMMHGSVSSDGDIDMAINNLRIDLCSQNDNTVTLGGVKLSQSTSICSTDSVKLSNVQLSDSSSIDVVSLGGSATVSSKSTFGGSFNISSSTGSAVASACTSPTLTMKSAQLLVGSCGGQQSRVSVRGYNDASFASEDTSVPSGAKRWSDPATWGGQLPKDGEAVTIAEGDVILLDTTTASLGNLDVRGTLMADPSSDFWLSAESINVYGTLRVGWLSSPYTHNGRFTLTGAKSTYTSRAPLLAFSNDGVSRGLRAHNGAQLELHGTPRTTYTRLNDHASQNDTVLTVDSVEGWNVGDDIVISPTTFVTTSQSDKRRIVAIDQETRRVTIDSGLSFARWGKLQYVTDQGLSLTPGVFQELKAHPDVADVLDERAVIVHLTRNIVIEAPNDTHWQQGHGVHVMWMGVSTRVHLNGVEVRRCGQAGALGRYPLHAHMQSYNLPSGSTAPSDGTFLGDVDVFVRNCAVHQSVNRAIVVHGTCGAQYVNNVAYDILGHAYFFEDGSEVRNDFIGNVVLNVRKPIKANQILLTEDFGSAGIWFSNGNNRFRDNIAGDIRNGVGIWNAFARKQPPQYVDVVTPPSITFNMVGAEEWRRRHNPMPEIWTFTARNATHWSAVGTRSGVQADLVMGVMYDNGILTGIMLTGTATAGAKVTFRVDGYVGGCFGQSRNVFLFPQFTPMFDYFNNTAFSCSQQGVMTDFSVIDELGNTESYKYITTNDSLPGEDHNNPRRVFTTFVRHRLWMNSGGGYANRLYQPHYVGWIGADNYGTDLRGATQIGKIEQGLFIGHSLNTLEPQIFTRARHAFATYHFSLDFHDMVIMNYPPLPRRDVFIERKLLDMPGAVESWDLYLNAIEMGSNKLRNWKQFNVTQFERTPPPNIEYLYPYNAGGPDVDRRYWTFSGAMYDNEGILAGRHGDYIIFNHTFLTYGLSNIRRVGTPESLTVATSDKFFGLQVGDADTRDATNDAVTFVRLDSNYQYVANWSIASGLNAIMLPNMRHASVLKGGIYRVYNPDVSTPNSKIYRLLVSNANNDSDSFIVGFPWSASAPVMIFTGRAAINPANGLPYDGELTWGWQVIATEVNSRNLMVSTPRSWWRDTATNQIWFHYQGGFPVDGAIHIYARPPV